MDIKDKVIDVFENRIMQLITITNIRKLPQWDDVDVLGADCLLKEYRRLTNKSSGCEYCGGKLQKSPSGILYCHIHGVQSKHTSD